jgi:hypothetical protein
MGDIWLHGVYHVSGSEQARSQGKHFGRVLFFSLDVLWTDVVGGITAPQLHP